MGGNESEEGTLVKGTIFLLFIALVFRVSGAPLRVGSPRLPIRTVGWILCALAPWIAACAMGAWFPLWPVLLLGSIAALGNFRSIRHALWIGADSAIVILAGSFSLPPLEFELLGVTAVAATGVGFMVDSALDRSPHRVRSVVALLPFGACLTLGLIGLMQGRSMTKEVLVFKDMLLQHRLFHIGITPEQRAERIVLETGAVVWLEKPPGKGPFPGALFFHGANPHGSTQSSALIVRRALLGAGFIVLSLDHPGYGLSPAPPHDAGVGAWDPLPTVRAAYNLLGSTSGVNRIFALGHSMGSTDVLRLLEVEPGLAGAVIFGGALGDPNARSEYWYGRFHTDRKMDKRLSREAVLEIRKSFYEDGRLLQKLPNDHAPILFANFGVEHSNIIAGRNAYYDAIPGRKEMWNISNSSHYFNSDKILAGLVLGDTRITCALASKFRLLGTGHLDGMGSVALAKTEK